MPQDVPDDRLAACQQNLRGQPESVVERLAEYDVNHKERQASDDRSGDRRQQRRAALQRLRRRRLLWWAGLGAESNVDSIETRAKHATASVIGTAAASNHPNAALGTETASNRSKARFAPDSVACGRCNAAARMRPRSAATAKQHTLHSTKTA